MIYLAQRERRLSVSSAAVFFVRLILALLGLSTALFALASGVGFLPLPYQLFLVLQRLPIAFPLHMIASGLALILIPIAAAMRHHRRSHRAVGSIAAVCVVAGGGTALFVALASEATLVARMGFFVQGLAWLGFLFAAVAAIRRGDRALHARLMIAMACIASGALWLRLFVAGAVAFNLPFDVVYAVAAWACWLVPLALVSAITMPTGKPVRKAATEYATNTRLAVRGDG